MALLAAVDGSSIGKGLIFL